MRTGIRVAPVVLSREGEGCGPAGLAGRESEGVGSRPSHSRLQLRLCSPETESGWAKPPSSSERWSDSRVLPPPGGVHQGPLPGRLRVCGAVQEAGGTTHNPDLTNVRGAARCQVPGLGTDLRAPGAPCQGRRAEQGQVVRPRPPGEGEPLQLRGGTGLSISGMKPGLDINVPYLCDLEAVGHGGPFLPRPKRPVLAPNCFPSTTGTTGGPAAPTGPSPQPTWVGQTWRGGWDPSSPQAPPSITPLHPRSSLGSHVASPPLHREKTGMSCVTPASCQS